ncbi:hypothetical protein [Bacillus infantis]|nr:hypothetical protein [Bacillus infantis]
MGLRFTVYENPQEFLQKTEGFLLKHQEIGYKPAADSVMLKWV